MEFPDLPSEITAFSDDEGAVIVIDIEGVVIFLNAPAEKLLGVDAEDIVGEFVELLVPDGKRWGHQAYRRGYFAEPNKREMDPGLYPEAERPDGELVPIAMILEPIRVNGKLYAAGHITQREPAELTEGEG
jgi:PAS domain S-box-containing protein